MEDAKISADGVPHSKLKQPDCPWCKMPMRCGTGWHVEGFAEHGLCGSKWFPDFEDGHLEAREQHSACKEIARLRAQVEQLQALQRSADPSAWLVETAGGNPTDPHLAGRGDQEIRATE